MLSSADVINLSVPMPFIIKPAGEDASIDINDNSVIFTEEQYFDMQSMAGASIKNRCFIESYIEGREINVSLLSDRGKPEVLPPSEIIFEHYPDNKPHIVNYNAKWCPDSFEYGHTPRRFEFSPTDRPLLSRLQKIASRCWECFGLRGYARIDFRIDENDKPWVIDINGNPCLSPDSGFVATACNAGYTYEGIITRILDEACFYSPYSQLSRIA
jgi:D-alanine-D-alanine ligase